MSFDEAPSIVDIPHANRGRKVSSLKRNKHAADDPDADPTVAAADGGRSGAAEHDDVTDDAGAHMTLRTPRGGSGRRGASSVNVDDDEMTLSLGANLPGVLSDWTHADEINPDKPIKSFTLFYGYDPGYVGDEHTHVRQIRNEK